MVLAREYYQHFSSSRYYLLFLFGAAFTFMVTGLIPFEVILIPAVVATPLRSRKLVMAGVLGSSVGAMALAWAFRVYGRYLMLYFFPGLGHSENWLQTEEWISSYGFF